MLADVLEGPGATSSARSRSVHAYPIDTSALCWAPESVWSVAFE